MRWALFFLLLMNCLSSSSQFSYFNQINGEQGDLSSENSSNVEVVDDGYVIWGGGVNNDTLFYYTQKYDLSGNFLEENILYDDSAEFVYTGRTKSFQWNPYTQTFVFIQGVNLIGQSRVEGYLIEFDTNLDTVFTRRYNEYAPYTYPFVFRIEEDGYVVVGETGGISYSAGTFIMKLDFEGNVIWKEVMEPLVYEDIYRNWTIEKLNDGYLIAGRGKTEESNYENFGLLTFTNLNGEVVNEMVLADDTMLYSSAVISTRISNGEIILTQGFAYAHYEGTNNPFVFYNLIRFGKYNEVTGEIENQIDYFHDYAHHQMGGSKVIATSDGGVLTLGSRPGLYFDRKAWMLKLNADLEQEWYKEYTYETCNDCANILYDVELAPDGGYVAAGHFSNLAVDGRRSSWLLKVDACGDVEWQGCAPVGVAEKETRSFSVYPNPSSGRFTVETSENENISSWSVYNLTGQKVAQANAQNAGQSFEINLSLPSGLYALELVQANGKRENHKIQILK